LAVLQANTKARQEIEQKTAESISRLETIIAGTQSKGSAGENIVELIFAKLPVEWQVRNFKVNGKTVEFGLRFPNNLVLPIDSKWTATDLLEQFMNSDDPDEQQKLKTEIERAVIQKAKEVRKYIDPSITTTFGVAVVPDAIYELCASIYPDIFRVGIVLVSYSMFVPYLLLVFHTILKSEQNIDLQKLDAYLRTAQSSLNNLQEEINGRFSRALTMLNNSRDDMQAHISSVNTSLTGVQVGTISKNPQPKLPDTGSLDE
jgi:DNA recombination protein RmuC